MSTGKEELRYLRNQAEEAIRKARCGEEQPYVALAEAIMYQTAVLDNAVDAFYQAATRYRMQSRRLSPQEHKG